MTTRPPYRTVVIKKKELDAERKIKAAEREKLNDERKKKNAELQKSKELE